MIEFITEQVCEEIIALKNKKKEIKTILKHSKKHDPSPFKAVLLYKQALKTLNKKLTNTKGQLKAYKSVLNMLEAKREDNENS